MSASVTVGVTICPTVICCPGPAGVFALVGFGRSIERYEKRHCWACLFLLLAVIGFGVTIYAAGNRIGDVYGPDLRYLEDASSP